MSTDPEWLSDLDEGIRYAVRVLDRHGVETYESCQGGPGHPDNADGQHAYPEPSVRFHGTDAGGWHALGVALDYGLPIQSLSRIWTFDRGCQAVPHGPTWQLTFFEQCPDPLQQPTEVRYPPKTRTWLTGRLPAPSVEVNR